MVYYSYDTATQEDTLVKHTVSSFGGQRVLLALVAAAVLVSSVYAAEPATEDPTAQAATYEKQATDLRASAAKHEQLAKLHRAGGGSSKTQHESIANHCDLIAKNLRAAADESDALAATYRGLAPKP